MLSSEFTLEITPATPTFVDTPPSCIINTQTPPETAKLSRNSEELSSQFDPHFLTSVPEQSKIPSNICSDSSYPGFACQFKQSAGSSQQTVVGTKSPTQTFYVPSILRDQSSASPSCYVDNYNSGPDKYLRMDHSASPCIMEHHKPRHIRQRSLGDSKLSVKCSPAQGVFGSGLPHQRSLQDQPQYDTDGTQPSASFKTFSPPSSGPKSGKFLHIPTYSDTAIIPRSPRKSLGSVWRTSSNSPARQFGAWFHGRKSKLSSGISNSKDEDREIDFDYSSILSRDLSEQVDMRAKYSDCEPEHAGKVRPKSASKRSMLTGSRDSSVPKDSGRRVSAKDIKYRGDKFHFRGADRREVKSWCDERLSRLLQGLQNTRSDDVNLLSRSSKCNKNVTSDNETREGDSVGIKMVKSDCHLADASQCHSSESNADFQFNERFLLGYCNPSDGDVEDPNYNECNSGEETHWDFCESNTVKRRPNPLSASKQNPTSTSASPSPSLGSSSSEASPSDINNSNSDNVNNNDNSTEIYPSDRPTPSGRGSISQSTSISCEPSLSPMDGNIALSDRLTSPSYGLLQFISSETPTQPCDSRLSGDELSGLPSRSHSRSRGGPANCDRSSKDPHNTTTAMAQRANRTRLCLSPSRPVSSAHNPEIICSVKSKSPRIKLNTRPGRRQDSSACVTR